MSLLGCSQPIPYAKPPAPKPLNVNKTLLAWSLFGASLLIPFLVLLLVHMLCYRNRYFQGDPAWQKKMDEAQARYRARVRQLAEQGYDVEAIESEVESSEASDDGHDEYRRAAFGRECLAPLDQTPPTSPVAIEMMRLDLDRNNKTGARKL